MRYRLGRGVDGPRLWPTPRFALVVATVVYMFVTLLRSTLRSSEPRALTGNRFWTVLTDSRQFSRLHGGVLMMLGISELSIRSETDVPPAFIAVNDVLVTLLLVTAAATMTLIAVALTTGPTSTAEPSQKRPSGQHRGPRTAPKSPDHRPPIVMRRPDEFDLAAGHEGPCGMASVPAPAGPC